MPRLSEMVQEAQRSCLFAFRPPISSCAYIDVIVCASYFAAYEVTKKRLTPADSTDLSLSAVILAGGTAGVAMWTIAIPPDVSIVVIVH